VTHNQSQSDPGKNGDPEISVILPCYNSHNDLQETLTSLQNQTFRNFEIILVNDGSDDPDTISFLERCPDNITIITQMNMGLSAARNTGIRNARGTYILPLDCDDWLDSSYLSRVYEKLLELPECSFVFTHMTMLGDVTGVLRKDYNHFEQLFLNQLPYCLFMRKSVWHEMGGYDESMRRGYEDWEYNIRLGRNGYKGYVIPEPLFNYRISKTGMLKSISQKLHGNLWRSIQKKNKNTYSISHLIRCWSQWRKVSSTYPLYLFFGWLLLHRFLPTFIFNMMFSKLLPYRSSMRQADLPK
jgi:hypothetical protein